MTHDLVIKFTSKMGDLASHSDFQYFQAPFSSWDDSLSGAKAVADFLRENTAKILVQSAKDWRCWKILEAHWDHLAPLPPTYAGSRFQRQHLGNGDFLLRPPAGLVLSRLFGLFHLDQSDPKFNGLPVLGCLGF